MELRAGESIETAAATVTNQGSGIYTFTPIERSAEEQAAHEAAHAAWKQEFRQKYLEVFGEYPF
jgi:hypothetical protein